MAKNLILSTILDASTSEVKYQTTKNFTIPLYLISKTPSQKIGLKRNFIIAFYNTKHSRFIPPV